LDIDAKFGDPYVEIHLAGPGLKGEDTLKQTPSVKGIPTHAGLMYKWLKDYKLSVPDKTRTSVTAVVKQKGRDVEVGSVKIDVSKVEGNTQVKWHKIEDSAKQVKGEICLVLRYVIKKDAGRGDRAASPRGERASSPRTERAERADRSERSTSESRKSGAVSPRREERQSGGERRSTTERIQSPVRERGSRSSVKAESTKPAGEARSEAKRASVAKGEGGGGGAGIFAKKGILVGLGAAVTGLVAMVAFRPQFYEVQEGDTICAVGICFNRNFREIQEKNPNIIDPDKIYPGQRLRL